MTFEFHVNGTERKALVQAMGEILKVKPKYMGMPSAAYEIDYFTVDKNGAVSFDDMADSEEIENLLDRLAERGFTAAEETTEEESEETEKSEHNATVSLTVEVPADSVNTTNLEALLDNKGNLIKKALDVVDLSFEVYDDKVSFPWFETKPELSSEECLAYTTFISALCKMSKEQKRINQISSNAENEKYAFRCFLLRLGFIGNEYKESRKKLLRNLSGSSAFKSGATKGVENNEISE